MFDRPATGERAILVQIRFPREANGSALGNGVGDAAGDDGAELRSLAVSAGAEIVDFVHGARRSPHPGTFLGSGKVAEMRTRVEQQGAELVIFDHSLTPSQERNLERELRCRVLDRIRLILDIFARRASSFEGKLQVELAQLKHISTRLVGGWTHLERQQGGIGLRGPGEKQLETDRRLVFERMGRIETRLERVRRRRHQGRRARARNRLPLIALVGYTNAGKSTLFNRLTAAKVTVADRLFATLDPTIRRLHNSAGPEVLLADTVGFVQRLPHELVVAFRATLEETLNADLLLHVVDAGAADAAHKRDQVNRVLARIGAGTIPQLEVWNKWDQVSADRVVDILPPEPAPDFGPETGLQSGPQSDANRPGPVKISAATGAGLSALVAALNAYFDRDRLHKRLLVPPAQGRLRSCLYRMGRVESEQCTGSGEALITVSLARADWERLCRTDALQTYELPPLGPGQRREATPAGEVAERAWGT